MTLAVTVFPSYISDFVEYFVCNLLVSAHGKEKKVFQILFYFNICLCSFSMAADLRPEAAKLKMVPGKIKELIFHVAPKEKLNVFCSAWVVCVVPRWGLQPRSSISVCWYSSAPEHWECCVPAPDPAGSSPCVSLLSWPPWQLPGGHLEAPTNPLPALSGCTFLV